jgi:UDP-N-acetylglucosamine 2-epimerase (non-hydrolysing)
MQAERKYKLNDPKRRPGRGERLRVLHVVGARPNFMKTAALMHAMRARPEDFEQLLVHTGQHYDQKMSQVFFDELGLPQPDAYLGVGSGSHALQTARAMTAFEPVLAEMRPDVVVVVGDVNSTLACALVASKLGVPVAHVEAGLRSFDRTMPEEINRILTDQVADFLFTPSPDGDENLQREGIPKEKIHFVGNVMIDTLIRLLPRAEPGPVLHRFGLFPETFVLVTLHRPSNVDDDRPLREIMKALGEIANVRPVVFPVHPRTSARMQYLGLIPGDRIRLVEPLGYLDFLALQRSAYLVMTDSGGVQEESTFLGIPCLTLRPNTERPITLTTGTNRLVDSEYGPIMAAVLATTRQDRHAPPELWDGHAAERISTILRRRCANAHESKNANQERVDT